MSIDKITSNKIVHSPSKIEYKNTVALEKQIPFNQELKNAQWVTSKVDKTAVAQESVKILPVQTNYHVLSQVRPTDSPEQLAYDAWNYIFAGKRSDFVNQAAKTEFALKVADFNLLTKEVEFCIKIQWRI